MSRISRLLLAVFGVTLLPTTAQATAVVSNVSFAQGSWYTTAGSPALLNSTFGRFDFDATPDPLTTSYLNLVGTYGANSAWMVRNFPLFDAVVTPGTVRFAADLDLADVGISDGTALSSMDYRFTVTTAPLSVAPGGTDSTASVTPVTYGLRRITAPGGEGKPDAPSPHKPSVPAPATDVVEHKGVPRVMEDDSECMPGAFARSIGWLNSAYNLNYPKTAQEIYSDLKALIGSGVGHPENKRIELKAGYLHDKVSNRAVTKVRDVQGLLPPMTGVEEDDTTDVLAWIRREMNTEDVELAVTYASGGAHIVTLVGLFKQGDDWYMRYRDDESQVGQGAGAGDTGIKTARFGKNTSGYWFGDPSARVYYAVSESVPEPAAALSIGLLTILTRRRRINSCACPVM